MPTMWSSRGDADLLQHAPSVAEAFEEFYARREAVVAAFLVRRCRDPQVVAELTAEVFATALLKAESFDASYDSAVPWLLGIADKLLLGMWRKGAVEQRALSRLGILMPLVSDASLERVERMVDAAAARPVLLDALSSLPEAQQEAVVAHVLNDEPYAELAGRLGIAETTIRQRVSRGLSQLRTALGGHV